MIESELLNTLATHLHLQWGCTPAPLPIGLTASAKSEPSATEPIPADMAKELLHLARMGHVLGLREAMTRWLQQCPEQKVTLQALQKLVDQFDLDGVESKLSSSTESEHE